MNIEPIWQADIQLRVFREVTEAFSRPGNIRDLTQYVGTCDARRAVLATLMDGETTLADVHDQVAASDWPLLQCRRAAPESARYVAADGRLPPNLQPSLGSLESPEFGATLLIEVESIGSGPLGLSLAGPGIVGRTPLHVAGLHAEWLRQRAEWNTGFPLGVDMLLADRTRIVALPRTTQAVASSGAM